MPVYTGRGDDGQTDLRSDERVSKASPRIEAYGTLDEVNALIGSLRPTGFEDLDDDLGAVQNDLHVMQAQLANPESDSDPRVTTDDIARIEAWIDGYDAELAPLTTFILPGGGDLGARLHHARTVCRRAERRVITLHENEPICEHVLSYLNRLSDLLFVLARVANAREDVTEEAPTY